MKRKRITREDGMEEERHMPGKESPFIQALGKYHRPEIGETINTDSGMAEIVGIKSYRDVVEEMERDGIPKDEIDGFTLRVEHFLHDRGKYFECLLRYEDDRFDSIDWGEYLRFKNRRAYR